MTTENYASLLADIASLSLFCALQEKPLLKNLRGVLRFVSAFKDADGLAGPPPFAEDEKAENTEVFFDDWAALVRSLAEEASFSSCISGYIIEDENPFTLAAERGKLSPRLTALAAADFSRLIRIASINITDLALAAKEKLDILGLSGPAAGLLNEARALELPPGDGEAAGSSFPNLASCSKDERKCVENFAVWFARNGAGLLGRFRAFTWISSGGGMLKPAANPDPVRFSDFSGFEAQHAVVKGNTLRFAEGKPANNLLLYGDRGTGKSAAVKAASNEYFDMGLRLVEIRKDALASLPALTSTLSRRGLKFILFIDDLSFEAADDSFTELKALLEGGVEKLPSNVVVYATSNRRHFVKEALQDKPLSGALRDFDTQQEQLSLADRFGLTVIYASPDQAEFLSIAEFLAARRGLLTGRDGEEKLKHFRENALRWERWYNGRSPRTALQYVDWLEGGEGFPWEER